MNKQTKIKQNKLQEIKTYIYYFQRTKESAFGDTFLKPLIDLKKEKKKERRKKEKKAQYITKQVLRTLRLWN